MDKRVLYVTIGALFVFSCYIFYSHMQLKTQYVDAMLTLETAQAAETPAINEYGEFVTFYICGEVINPDIYTLPKGSRIIDAVKEAGGETQNASFEMMESVAAEITDGQKIYVPNVDDDIDKINYMNNNSNSTYYQETPRKDPDIVVNINTAGVEELSKIPGIGELTATLIYDYRQENGDFLLIEDIKNVPRIGEKTFESIKKNITVD